jgi:hypothetical protein
MAKILESDFRNNLYKSLIEAGYSKSEAQRIVGVKYFEGLKTEINVKLTNVVSEVNNDNFDVNVEEVCGSVSFMISELKKLSEIIKG